MKTAREANPKAAAANTTAPETAPKAAARHAADMIVLRKGDLVLEIPATLPAEHVKAAISAAALA